MTRRQFALTCWGVLAAASISAQSAGTAPDPISGKWTGELVRQDAPRPLGITMNLKFDGKSAVSGAVSGLPNPADVKTGTFDPKTGALKLQLGRTGDTAVLLVLDGTVVRGTATGRFSGDDTGSFKITRGDPNKE